MLRRFGREQWQPNLQELCKNIYTQPCRVQITRFRFWKADKGHLCKFTLDYTCVQSVTCQSYSVSIFRGSTVVQTNFPTNIYMHTQIPVSAIGRFICPSQPIFTLPVFAGWSTELFLLRTPLPVKFPPSYHLKSSSVSLNHTNSLTHNFLLHRQQIPKTKKTL